MQEGGVAPEPFHPWPAFRAGDRGKSIPQKPLRAYLAPLLGGPLEFLSIILGFALPRSQPFERRR